MDNFWEQSGWYFYETAYEKWKNHCKSLYPDEIDKIEAGGEEMGAIMGRLFARPKVKSKLIKEVME